MHVRMPEVIQGFLDVLNCLLLNVFLENKHLLNHSAKLQDVQDFYNFSFLMCLARNSSLQETIQCYLGILSQSINPFIYQKHIRKH